MISSTAPVPSPVMVAWTFLFLSSIAPTSYDQTATRCFTFELTATENPSTVCILASDIFHEISLELASNLSLPLLSYTDLQSLASSSDECNEFPTLAITVDPYSYTNFQDYSVRIACLEDKKQLKKISMKPVMIDFLPPIDTALGRRTASRSADLLIQAISPKKDSIIYDLTAGFGQDSLLLARTGAQRVHMVERDPIVSTLLRDGLRRLRGIANLEPSSNCGPATKLASCLSFQTGEACNVIEASIRMGTEPDIVYLDPMFPAQKKAALVKKNMQILHALLNLQGENADTHHNSNLFDVSYQAAKHRLVVKRPIHADFLGGVDTRIKPSYQVKGSINRWDIYVK
jgi:16S rRNA (guanine1516-N2)-methyltransferase